MRAAARYRGRRGSALSRHDGDISFWVFTEGFLTPTLLGKIIGGIALVASAAHAEFFEIEKEKKSLH